MAQVNNAIKESIFCSVFDEQIFYTDLVPRSFTEDEVSIEEGFRHLLFHPPCFFFYCSRRSDCHIKSDCSRLVNLLNGS